MAEAQIHGGEMLPRCAALGYVACSAALLLGMAHGTDSGGTNLRKLFAESHHHDHPHAPEHVGDESTRRKADENIPHSLKGFGKSCRRTRRSTRRSRAC